MTKGNTQCYINPIQYVLTVNTNRMLSYIRHDSGAIVLVLSVNAIVHTVTPLKLAVAERLLIMIGILFKVVEARYKGWCATKTPELIGSIRTVNIAIAHFLLAVLLQSIDA